MALYTPIPSSAPRIVITAPNAGVNIVPWNRDYLATIWISQFFFLLFGMAFLPYTIEVIFSILTLFIGIASLGNLALVITPCIEAHKYAIGTLTPKFFYEIQLWKLRWTVGTLVALVLVQIDLVWWDYYKGVGSVVWVVVADVLYSVPFAAGLWYARQIMRQAGGTAVRDDDAESSVRLG